MRKNASLGRAGGLKWLVGVLFLVFLLCDPAGAAEAARSAMHTWAESVAPALFPFMAVLPLLTGVEARRLYAHILSRPMRALFALPGQAAAAVTVGLLAGSPAGAIACAHIADSMNPREFKRMALMSCGMSPVYLISGIGVSLLCGHKAGFLLAGAQIFAQITSGLILRFLPDARKNGGAGSVRGVRKAGGSSGSDFHSADFAEKTSVLHPTRLQRTENPLRTAAVNLLQVAGYMSLFAVIARFAGNLLGKAAGKAALMALDLPGGAAVAAKLTLSFPAKMALLGAMSGFGGVCIAAQNMAVLRPLGVKWREYLSAKCAHALICAALCFLGAAYIPSLQPAAAAFAHSGSSALEMSSLGMVVLLVPVICTLAGVRRRGMR